jgi:endonuclease/exonuclease/phosphatase family metal-dependent hydrolase
MIVYKRILDLLSPALRSLGPTVADVSQFIARRYQQLFRRYQQFPIAYTALGYLFFTMALCYYPVVGHWLTGFVMMTLPLAILGGFVACVYLMLKKQQMIATAGLIWVLFSFLVVKRLVGIQANDTDVSEAETLNVLSFNSETFSVGAGSGFNASALKADIACFQEYSPNPQIEGQYADHVKKLTCFDKDREIGLALFSNYPIVNQYGRIWNRSNGPDINGFVCADIAYGSDTIRVVNVHLWSMGVRTSQMVDALKAGEIGRFSFELFDTFRRLKEGFENRNEQLLEVESFTAGSRYPVIICGDFNETPIGYSYGKLSQNFSNAFEKAGKGLGFTLNRHPYCVRIDQQFASQDWHINTCQTLSGISFSDHFPVMAQYVLKKSLNVPASLLSQRKLVSHSTIKN